MKFGLILSHRAEKDVAKLGRAMRERLDRRFAQLREDPFDPRLTGPLKGHDGLRKSRVGDWRIVFAVDDVVRIVEIVMVEPRGQVYKRI